MSEEKENQEEISFKRTKKDYLKYFLIGFLISTIVILILSGIFILTLISVLR
ncbi:unnamed protein product, partial [marine sediment metagenome]